MILKLRSLIRGFLFIGLVQVFGFSLLIAVRSMGIGNSLLFEQITFLALIISLIVYAIRKAMRKFRLTKKFSYPSNLFIALASLLFFLLAQFSILNIDRSRSFYVLSWIHLEKIEIEGNSYDLSQVESGEKSNLGAIVDRIREQEVRGLVKVNNSKLQLTSRGETVLWVANTSGYLFHLDFWAANRK